MDRDSRETQNNKLNITLRKAYSFQDWGSWTSLKYQTCEPRLKTPPGRFVLGFLRQEIQSTSAGFELENLESRSEHIIPGPLLLLLVYNVAFKILKTQNPIYWGRNVYRFTKFVYPLINFNNSKLFNTALLWSARRSPNEGRPSLVYHYN